MIRGETIREREEKKKNVSRLSIYLSSQEYMASGRPTKVKSLERLEFEKREISNSAK